MAGPRLRHTQFSRAREELYVSQGLPGTPNVAYAEWTQATIEPNWPSQVPEVVRTLNAEMQAQLDSYEHRFAVTVLRAGHTGEASREGGLIKDLR